MKLTHQNGFSCFAGDNNYTESSSNVISAAETLAIAIQQCHNFASSPAPKKETSEIINSWLENFMPVSFLGFSLHGSSTQQNVQISICL
jgi:hypothetical protein